MKILIIGLGSIGQRHALNLIKIGYKNLIFQTPNKNKIQNKKLKKIKAYKKLNYALYEKPDLAFICTPTNSHTEIAIKLAKKKINFFMEKPVGNNENKIKKLIKLCKKNKIINMVGYMMRFHPAIIKLKSIINNSKKGDFFYFNSEWGEYLPEWNKYTKKNYKKNYAANKSMGGGVALTLSHDLDTARFLFGDVSGVSVKKNNFNPLKIQAESIIDFNVNFKNNIYGNIHLDYLQKNKIRVWNLIGIKKRVTFDYYKKQLLIKKEKGKIFYNYKKFDRNKLFLNEIKYFLNCLKKNKKTNCDVDHSYKTLKQFKLL
tara:strand:- start:26 stop:973 length:948 start_codon:yes stop_codon:yes gene_type:complete